MIGIDKSKKALHEADLVIALFDKTKKLSKEDFEILNIVKNKNSIILLNKKDLEKTETTEEDLKKYSKDILEVSIKDDDGIEELYNRMLNLFTNKEIKAENAEIITNIRHKDAISDALKSIICAENTINEGMTIDITAIYFKEAIENLNKITGEDVTDDIINDIFSKFCLGK